MLFYEVKTKTTVSMAKDPETGNFLSEDPINFWEYINNEANNLQYSDISSPIILTPFAFNTISVDDTTNTSEIEMTFIAIYTGTHLPTRIPVTSLIHDEARNRLKLVTREHVCKEEFQFTVTNISIQSANTLMAIINDILEVIIKGSGDTIPVPLVSYTRYIKRIEDCLTVRSKVSNAVIYSIDTENIVEDNLYMDMILHKMMHAIRHYPLDRNSPPKTNLFNLYMSGFQPVSAESVFRYHLSQLYFRGIIESPDYLIINSDTILKNPSFSFIFEKYRNMNVLLVNDGRMVDIADIAPIINMVSSHATIMIYSIYEDTDALFVKMIPPPSQPGMYISPDDIDDTEPTGQVFDEDFDPGITEILQSPTNKPFITLGQYIPSELANEYIEATLKDSDLADSLDAFTACLFSKGTFTSLTEISKRLMENREYIIMATEGEESPVTKFINDRLLTNDITIIMKADEEVEEGQGVLATLKSTLGLGKKKDVEPKTVKFTKPRKEKPVEEIPDPYVKLDALIGLTDVKKMLHDIVSVVRANKLYIENDITPLNEYFHMVFYGNPGTAKTTIARLCADIFHKEGLLKTNKFTEFGRTELVGQYVGHTADKVKRAFEAARGGVIFIDEAYSLTASQATNDFGLEAVNTIVQLIEDYRTDTIVIFAGYGKEMDQFIKSNPGLKSRITYNLQFKNYTIDELMEILESYAKEYKFILSDTYKTTCRQFFDRSLTKTGFGNGRTVRDIFKRSIIKHSARITDVEEPSITDIKTISEEDFPDTQDIEFTTKQVGFTK